MRQYVALAALLVCDPKLLLLDEADAWLDASQTKRLLAALRRRQEQGAAVVSITHDLNIAHLHATQALKLVQGRLDLEQRRLAA
jgi:energy-coupling factor transporter ATP-binding protein EcfA2